MRRILMRRILMRRILMRPIHYPVFVTKRLIFDHESHEWSNFTNIFSVLWDFAWPQRGIRGKKLTAF